MVIVHFYDACFLFQRPRSNEIGHNQSRKHIPMSAITYLIQTNTHDNEKLTKTNITITIVMVMLAEMSHLTSWENQQFAYAKTKTQISFEVIAKLISVRG